MNKTKAVGIITGIIFFLWSHFSGSDPNPNNKLVRILLIAAGVSQVTNALMAHELEKALTKDKKSNH